MSASQWIEDDFSLPLPLPEEQVTALRKIADRMNKTCASVRPGMIAVFAGCDAAGKLMAAEALAYELQRPLHRVDRSEIDGFSYGEPGKDFARILSAVRAENAILILENVDDLPNALFQTLEDHPGLSILITDSNQETSIALRNSTHYIVDFPFPFDNE
jgi:SpoVK/Ycf46/Vps4 family AAA+-type ATPase